ncbi:MAG: hypothetical protein V4683_12395 [Bacteroidota bacterium]
MKNKLDDYFFLFLYSLIKQLVIFLCYLFVTSLVLNNHRGGADIMFMFLLALSVLIHIIFSIIKAILKKKDPTNPWNWTFMDLFTLILIFVLFILISSYFLDKMFEITK